MSMPRHPRVIVNGVHRTRTYHYYWCRRCQRSLRTTTANPSEILCPRCFGQIRLELDVSRPGPLLESRLQPSPGARILDSLARMLDPPPPAMPGPNQNHDRAWILLQFIGPDPPSRPVSPPGQGLEGLIQELTQNDRPGPPAAPESAIEGLPLVELGPEHLKNDSHCPVCKDEFEVGAQVKELPCKHFYHSDCIVPWLHMHNTCPVCRYEVGGPSCDNNDTPRGDWGYDFDGFGYGDRGEDRNQNWGWRHLLSLRPFSLVLNWAHLCLDFLDDRVNISSGGMQPVVAILDRPLSLKTEIPKSVSPLGDIPSLKNMCRERALPFADFNCFRWSFNAFSTTPLMSLNFFNGNETVSSSEESGKPLSKTFTKDSSGRRPWTLTYSLVSANLLVYAAQYLSKHKLTLWLSKRNCCISSGQWWRLVTCAFLHANISHLLINSYSLSSAGPVVENIWGPKKYLTIYINSAVAGSTMSYWFNKNHSVGASGAICGLLGGLIGGAAVAYLLNPAWEIKPVFRIRKVREFDIDGEE